MSGSRKRLSPIQRLLIGTGRQRKGKERRYPTRPYVQESRRGAA